METADLGITIELANLALSEDEYIRLKSEAEAMVDYFLTMQKLDTTSIESEAFTLCKENQIRPDLLQSENLQDAILEQAPDLEDRFICIPNVL